MYRAPCRQRRFVIRHPARTKGNVSYVFGMVAQKLPSDKKVQK